MLVYSLQLYNASSFFSFTLIAQYSNKIPSKHPNFVVAEQLEPTLLNYTLPLDPLLFHPHKRISGLADYLTD